MAGTLLVNHPVGGEEAHHDSVGTATAAHFHFATYLFKLGVVLDKVICTRTHQYMGAEFQFMDTITDVLFCWGGATQLQLAA
jgi:hypothetical protein